jgi:hypothetical protein
MTASEVTNFPNGFTNGVTIAGVPIQQAHPGEVFFVNSTAVKRKGVSSGSDSTGAGTYNRPFATIDYAIGRCTASRGDIIMVMPGHTETVAAASGIDLDVAGVAIFGMGTGSLRPTINFTATASTLTMAAANCSISNLLLTGGVDAVVSPIVVSAADNVIENCEIRDVTGQMTDGILTTAGATRLKILSHKHDGATAAGTNSAIAIVGGDGIEITIDRMDGNFAVGGIDIRTTATTDLFVHDVKYFRTRNAADIFLVDTITASTGQVGPDVFIRLPTDAQNITEAVTGATLVIQDPVYVVNAANEKGMLINWTATTDAIV